MSTGRIYDHGHTGMSSLESTPASSSFAFCTRTCTGVVDGALVGWGASPNGDADDGY